MLYATNRSLRMEEEGRRHQFEAAFDSGGGQPPQHEDPQSQARIAETANQLGVPSVLLETAEARAYLGLHNELADVQQTISTAHTHFDTPRTPSSEQVSPGIHAILQENYSHALPLLQTAQMFSEEGLGVRTLSARALKEALHPAIVHLGLVVAEQPTVGRQGVVAYYDRIHAHAKTYEQQHKADMAQREAADDNVRYPLVAMDQQTRLLVPYGRYAHTAAVRSYTTIVNALSQARQRIDQQYEALPTEEEGYQSHDQDRYRFAAYCLELASYTLHERLGLHTSPLKYINHLNLVLDPHHLHVDVATQNTQDSIHDHEKSMDVRRLIEDWRNDQQER
jgi:hypothetical protein